MPTPPVTRSASKSKDGAGATEDTGQLDPLHLQAQTNQLMQQMLMAMQQQQKQQAEDAKIRHQELMQVLNVNPATEAISDSSTPRRPPQQPRQARQPDPNRPTLLDTNITLEQFDAWKLTWQDYSACYQFDESPLDQQVARFRTFLTPDMRTELIHGIGISDDEGLHPVDILDRIRAYIRSKRNVALDRVKFEERVQGSGESFDAFYVSLRQIAANADLCTGCIDERLTTRIMVGVSDAESKRKLLTMKPFPTCQQAVDLCRSEETARANEAALGTGNSDGSQQVSKVSDRRRSRSRRKGANVRQRPGSKDGNDTWACWFCGRGDKHSRKDCPAADKKCQTCGITGHFATVCKSGQKSKTKQGRQLRQISLKVSATRYSTKKKKAPTLKVDLFSGWSHDKYYGEFTVVPDSAAEATVASTALLKQMGMQQDELQPPDGIDLIAANDKALKCIGSAKITVKVAGRKVDDTVYFCEGQQGMLLAWFTCKALGILPPSYPNPTSAAYVQAVADHNLHKSMQEVIGNIPENPSDKQKQEIREKLLAEFADVFHVGKELKPMKCPPMKIKLRDNAVAFSIRVPRRIPHAWQNPVKSELDELVEQKVIAPIDDDDTTEWCHPIVCVPKKDGGVRVCVDLTKLNPYVIRPLHPLITPKDAVSQIPNGMRYFTVLDARKGYWQMELAPESQNLTTFLTPWGRYKFLRAPMGLSSTGDEFCHQGDKALSGLGNLQKVVDDSVVYDENFPAHIQRIWNVLTRCREKSISMNPKKLQFAEPEVAFCGYILNADGVKIDPNKIKAITEFPEPTNLTELRSFMGMVNQIGEFSKDVSKAAEPLRPLLSTRNAFSWQKVHMKSFEDVKRAISSPPVLAHFDLNAETALHTDASRKNGMGFVLMQKQGDVWKIIECGSRFLIPAETRYAMVELELAAVEWATRKLRVYLQGLHQYTVVTDHKPLIPILNTYTMADIQNPRIQRLKGKLAGYVFKAVWRKGKDHCIPDAFSRAPVDKPSTDDIDTEAKVNQCHIASIRQNVTDVTHEQTADPLIQDLAKAAKEDARYQELTRAVSIGFEDAPLTPYLATFRKMADQLSTDDGLVYLGHRIVVPQSARKSVLTRLHAAHQGIEKTKRRARQCVYWPGMNSDIRNTVETCQSCHENLPSQAKEPIMSDPKPDWVFREVAADLFAYAGRHYLVYVDRLSGWPVLYDFGKNDPTSRDVIRAIRRCFSDLGVPIKFRSDNGPQFASSQFKRFLTNWGVKHETSSPHYPQSNGLAESAVKAMKAIVKKTTTNGVIDDDACTKAILEYRNTPRACGASPAEIVMGHSLRSHVPAHRSLFEPQWREKMEAADEKAAKLKETSDMRYNQSAKPLSPLRIRDEVCVQDKNSKKWDSYGQIVAIGPRREYLVKMPSGRLFMRNRRFLRKFDKPDAGENAKRKKQVHFQDDEPAAVHDPAPRRSSRRRKPPERFSP